MMQRSSRVLIGTLGALLMLYVAAVTYWLVAPRVFGPEKAVTALCTSIQPGMTTAALTTRLSKKAGFVVSPLQQGQQSVSKYVGNWMCTCGVRIENNQVVAVKNVVCVD